MSRKRSIPGRVYPGVTSLFVTIVVAMVLITVIAGVAAFSIREQRQASNTDLSSRALQTAEAGIKQVSQDLTAGQSAASLTQCPATNINPFGDSTDQSVTCQVVTTEAKQYEGFIQQDRAVQFEVGPGAKSLFIRWHNDKVDSQLSQYFFSGSYYPTASNYQNAAAMEVNLIYWPNNITSALEPVTTFFMPGQADQAHAGVVTSGCYGGQNPPSSAQLGDYRCVTLDPGNTLGTTGFNLAGLIPGYNPTGSNYSFMVRIKPRYANTHYLFQMFDSSGKPMLVKSTTAQIDVTAKTGNLYRRVKAEKPLIPTVLENVFDAVLYTGRGDNDQSNKNICKTLVVTEQSKLVSPNCN